MNNYYSMELFVLKYWTFDKLNSINPKTYCLDVHDQVICPK